MEQASSLRRSSTSQVLEPRRLVMEEPTIPRQDLTNIIFVAEARKNNSAINLTKSRTSVISKASLCSDPECNQVCDADHPHHNHNHHHHNHPQRHFNEEALTENVPGRFSYVIGGIFNGKTKRIS